MSIKGITFDAQNVTAKNDGGLYQAHFGDGILWGCGMSVSGSNLVIQKGHFLCGGRSIQVDGSTNIDLSGTSLAYKQVVFVIDTSQPAGYQWSVNVVGSTTTTFPALTQNAINDTGSIYQMEIAVIQTSNSSIIRQMPYSNLVSLSSIDTAGINSSANIFVDRGGSGHKGFYLTDGGTNYGRASYNGTAVQFIRTDSGGNATGGIQMASSNTYLFGNNGTVYLRPNGSSSSAGETSINSSGNMSVGGNISATGNMSVAGNISATGKISCSGVTGGLDITGDLTVSGQQIGGHGYQQADNSGNVSISAGTWKEVGNVTPSAGVGTYLATGYIVFSPTANMTGTIDIGMGTNTTAGGQLINSSYHSISSSGSDYFALTFLASSATTIRLWLRSTSAGTVSSWRIRTVRIA